MSVVIPMYNAACWVGEAIESVRAQDLRDLEILVVDDGSTDDGPAIARAHAARDRRVRVVSQANRGLSGARNRGLEASRSPYVLFLDADDWLEPGALSALLPTAGRRGCAAGWSEWRLSDGSETGWVSDWLAGTIGQRELLERNRFPTHALLLSREVIGDERFDESLTGVEDWDMWMRLAAHGAAWEVVERVTCGYRLRAASMSHGFENMARCTQRVIERAHAGLVSPPDTERVLTRHLLALATAAAVADEAGGLGRGESIMRMASGGGGLVSAEEAVVAAHWMGPFALGLPPNAWGWASAPIEYLGARLSAWWGALARCGRGEAGLAERAGAALPRCTVSAYAVVERLADDLGARGARDSGAIVVGYGQNGRLLARELVSRGVRVRACDDACRGMASAGVEVGAVEEPGDMAGAPCVVTPLVDGPLVERVARWGRPVLRWSTTQDAIASATSARLSAALRAA